MRYAERYWAGYRCGDRRLIGDLDFDGAFGWVRGDVESLDGFGEGNAVSDEGFEVDETSSDESDCLGVLQVSSSS